jgi:RNA polymerase sigma-70 factor (ECF subfamily)
MSDKKEARFESLLSQHKGILYKIARSYSYCQENQRDLIQDITLQLWRSFDSYDPDLKLSTWVYRVAMNTAISFLRRDSLRKKHHITTDVMLIDEPQENGNEELMLEIQRMLKRLNKFDRAMFIMHLDGLDYATISDVLKISASNIGTRLSRIKQQLNKEFFNR